MDIIPVYVGLDYHQSAIQVCVMTATGRVLINRSCENRWEAVRNLVEAAGTPRRVALEACTGASDLAQELVDRAGWSVDLAHTTYVARMKRQPDKTDYSDARMLADLTRVGYLPRVWLPPVYIRDLRRLVSLRYALVKQRGALKLRLAGLLRDHRAQTSHSRWSIAWRAWVQAPETLPPVGHLIAVELLDQLRELAQRIVRVETQLDRFTAADPIVAYLQTLPCVGSVTAWVLRAMIGEVTRFKNGKQLAHYCGLSPGNASSGLRMADAGLVASGNPLLRLTLIELAHRLRNTQAGWKALGQGMHDRGKHNNVIAAAIANRFIRKTYYAWQAVQRLNTPTVVPVSERPGKSEAAARERVDTQTGVVSSSR